MTTFAELKTNAAAVVADPDMTTFTSSDLGYYLNSGIAEVSRIAPQRFSEDVQLVEGSTSYQVRGGGGNLVANPSFETGDDTLLIEGTAYYAVVAPGDSSLLGGWEPSGTMIVGFQRNGNAKTGKRVGGIWFPTGTTTKYLYQYIPVNVGTTYDVSGWHWNDVAGGDVLNLVQFDTVDDDLVTVTLNAVSHTTTAAAPQAFSGSISIPDDGTVSFIRVGLYAYTVGTSSLTVSLRFEDISVSELGEGSLVAANSLDQIEVNRVEVWSTEFDPSRFIARIPSGNAAYLSHSEAGWEYWDGRLTIPYRVLATLDTAADFLRVRGYAPYDKLLSDTQVTDLSFELEQAVMSYVKMQALERLVFERDLFTQWQTRSGNSDVSPASLMSSLSLAREDWRRKSRSLMVLREVS